MNIWALIASLILSWDLTVGSFYHLPLINVQVNDQDNQAILTDQILDDQQIIPHKKDNTSWGVKISAQAAAVLDESSDMVLWQKNAQAIRSLASITKLMTALVWLEHNPGWEVEVTMQVGDETKENKAHVHRGETVTTKDLFFATLVASDNNATRALVRSTGIGEKDFVKLMNDKARALELSDTVFFDVTGLNDDNRSTALDVLKLAKQAFANPDIKAATSLKSYSLTTKTGRQQRVISTNNLLNSYLRVSAGKTGSTTAAGYCLVSEVETKDGQKIIGVVLGATSHEDRFQDLKILLSWVMDNYLWS